jgi:hypothetical protein
MDMNELPRVNLNDLIDQGYQPVSVGTEAGNEYIVVAKDLHEQHGLSTPVQPTLPFEDEAGQQLATIRQRAGLQRSGRPSSVPRDINFPENPSARIGIGQNSGAIRVTPNVDLTSGEGVGAGAAIPNFGAELGSSVPSPFTSWIRREYNADLFGIKGLRIYDRMRKSDGTVRGTLRLAKTPVLAGQWSMKPASSSTKDKMIANFVWKNLTQWMTTSWPQLLTEALLMLDFGYYMFEKVFAPGEQVTNDPDARGKIVWQKLAPRHPMDVREWFFDLAGGPLSVDMWTSPALTPGLQGGVYEGYGHWINIPINKLLVFTFDKEAGNIEGISLLRSAYKHWYYKDNLYKIDAIQKERHGIGVPVIALPVGYSGDDLKTADALGRNLRTNDRAHVVLPPNWGLTFAELKGQPVDCIRSIEHHDTQLEKQILGQFLQPNMKTDEADQTLFLKATRFTADIVTDTINSYAVPQLVDMNWANSAYPQLTVKRIGEQEDWRTYSFALRNYVGAGIIVPDQPMEDQIRDEMGLPPADMATSRIVRSPSAMNPQKIEPAQTELPGTGHEIIPAQEPGAPPTPDQPRQGPPSAPAPSTGRGDGSGTSGRRGQ